MLFLNLSVLTSAMDYTVEVTGRAGRGNSVNEFV